MTKDTQDMPEEIWCFKGVLFPAVYRTGQKKDGDTRYIKAENPVAWRVKDYADGWIYFSDEIRAMQEHNETGGLIEPLYK